MLFKSGGSYSVFVGGETLSASIRGRVKHTESRKILVGDRVELEVSPDGSATIEGLCERTSTLTRRNPGKRRGVREVAANVDQVVVVGAARRPDWDVAQIDRFVVVAEANDLPSVLVVNKLDLVSSTDGCRAPYVAAGYRVLSTSAKTGAGVAELRNSLVDRTSLFTGPSGVGKSSLANAINPGLDLRTGEVSRKSGAGRHTTVGAEMFPLDGGGFLVDTPGLRDIGLWGIEPREVQHAYPEIANLASGCRFDDCRHVAEPGCAVMEAAHRNDLNADRLSSYQQLLREAIKAGEY